MQPVGWFPSWLQRAAHRFLAPQENQSMKLGPCSSSQFHLGNLHKELRRSHSMNPDDHLNTEAAMEGPFPQRWHCQHPELQAVPAHSPYPQTSNILWLSWLTQGSCGHHTLPNPHSWQFKCLLPEQIPLWDSVLPHNSCCPFLISSFRSLSCALRLQRWAFIITLLF